MELFVRIDEEEADHDELTFDINLPAIKLIKAYLEKKKSFLSITPNPSNVAVYYQGSDYKLLSNEGTLVPHGMILTEKIGVTDNQAYFRMEIKLATSSTGHLEIDHGTIEYPSRNKLLSFSLYSVSKGISSQITGDDFVFQPEPVF